MSNTQFKREEAKYHNEQYAAKRYREQHNLPEWQDVSQHQKLRDLFPTDGVEGCPNLDEIDEIKITAATESKITEQQAVGRSDRGTYDVVVIGAGHHGRNHPALRGVDLTGAKNIAFATPELLGEMSREQAREQMRRENGRYGKGF